MKLIDKQGDYILFAPRKNEETTTAIERISDTLQCSFSYFGVTKPTDKLNGCEHLRPVLDRIDFEKYNCIIVKI